MKQVNVRRPAAVDAARELAAGLNIPISRAIELALLFTLSKLKRHSGHPAEFEAVLKIEAQGGEQ